MEKVLTIQRSKWLRGEGSKVSRMLRPSDGRMCCLGQEALAFGVPESCLLDQFTPRQVMGPPAAESYYQRMRPISADLLWDAMKLNDSPDLDDDERESRLIPLLKQIGGYDRVEFVD